MRRIGDDREIKLRQETSVKETNNFCRCAAAPTDVVLVILFNVGRGR